MFGFSERIPWRAARWAVGVLATAWLPCVAAIASEPDPQVWIDGPRWTVSLPSEKFLRVLNPLGDIRARKAGGDELTVLAIVQRFSIDQKDAKVEIRESAAGVEVVTRYPSAEKKPQSDLSRGRIDLTLLVPAGRTFDLQTASGLLESKGIERNVKARTDSGRIRITSSLKVSAQSETGSMLVVLRDPGKERSAELSTKSGEIRLDYLRSDSIALEATTRGKIISSSAQDEGKVRRLEDGKSKLRIGSAPPFINIRSETGGIQLMPGGPLDLR